MGDGLERDRIPDNFLDTQDDLGRRVGALERIIETVAGAQAKANVVQSNLDVHEDLEKNVHGIADTSLLETVAGARAYVQARGMNLVANGSGLLLDNYNFSGFDFDQVETHGGAGSFKNSNPSTLVFSDEYIPISGDRHYHLSLWAKSTTYVPGNRALLGLAMFDIDKFLVSPYFFMRIGGTDTTLAVSLNVGDTTITLSSSANWLASDVQAYRRQALIFGYTNSFGYTYPDYTYSRKATRLAGSYANNGLWSIGSIAGNVITLTEPWPSLYGNIPAGTAISNGSSGGTYKYIAASNVEIPNMWAEYSGQVGGWDTNGVNATNMFPYGSAYARLLFLLNRNVSGNVTNASDLWFSELAGENLSGRLMCGDTVNPAAAGQIRFNSSTNKHEGYDGTSWNALY